MLLATDKYTYLHNSDGIHLWKNGLIAAVFITAIYTILMIKKKIRLKDNRISESLEKQIRSGSRSPTKYVFITNVNDERKEFYVSESDYFNLSIGTSFPVQLYKGAFGHDYYTYYR